jgi:mannose-6-phosphate isomerase-like protein (cupin superfamily)
MRMRSIALGLAAGTFSATLMAQGAPAPMASPVDLQPASGVAAKIAALMPKAQASASGVASEVVQSYPGQALQLFVRAGKDGGGEAHANFNDLFIVEEGEANIMTGGTIVDAKEASPGETRGTKLEGAKSNIVHKGDVFHVSPGVPHQTLLIGGKPFAYYVVKIAAVKP